MKCVRAKGVLIFKCFIKITLYVFYPMYEFGKKYAIVTGGVSMTQLIAMSADVAYQAIINTSSKIRRSTIIDIITASDVLSLMEIENNGEIRCFSKNREVDIPESL
jgi:hypothetical protein